jgi:hypothetical protein
VAAHYAQAEKQENEVFDFFLFFLFLSSIQSAEPPSQPPRLAAATRKFRATNRQKSSQKRNSLWFNAEIPQSSTKSSP